MKMEKEMKLDEETFKGSACDKSHHSHASHALVGHEIHGLL